MREIIRKIGSFFEEHVEKVVLGVAAVACLVVLFLFVIQSPNKVSYDGEKYSPGKIDDRIYQQTQALQETLGQEPKASELYIARLNGHVDPNDPVREGVWGDPFMRRSPMRGIWPWPRWKGWDWSKL